jgi:hypothetical protein
VDKDFACLDGSDSDDLNTFATPNLAASCHRGKIASLPTQNPSTPNPFCQSGISAFKADSLSIASSSNL